MVVQHNLTAMNSNRMLGLTTASQAKSTEKLSSGYKINRAADDAAGLSISEKMRKQIRGLTQASSNAQDGISAVQTAEGALNEVQDMLQRMNELAVKAANGTQAENDRSYIQNEIDQLVTEIDRVSTTTKFNESYLLKGVNQDGTAAKLTYKTASGNITDIDENTGKKEYALGTATKKTVTDKGEYNVSTVEVMGKKYGLVTGIKDADTAGGKTLSEKEALADAKANADVTDGAFATQDELIAQIKKDLNEAGAGDIKSISVDKDGKVTVEAFADLNASLNFSLHVGADSTEDNKIDVDIAMMSARGLGVNGIQVSGDDDTKATAAIDTISAAIQKVSTQRSALGAVQNRLEHTINNLDNVVENTTSAESAIRDTDMATEMVKYSNNNILSQAGQAMLAQSNQANQGVLSLLQ
ncbi:MULTISPECIES: flagellin [Waltera]|uniref:flagellin N-terminal helical domain-containing protein n=1 Tax=Waltera TaxID=2815781 RepID=UPI0021CE9AA7|nr:flagellin [Brotolimicola acetigignens]MCU6759900.1 flagellin [Brotolimicola acetigignens]